MRYEDHKISGGKVVRFYINATQEYVDNNFIEEENGYGICMWACHPNEICNSPLNFTFLFEDKYYHFARPAWWCQIDNLDNYIQRAMTVYSIKRTNIWESLCQ